MRSQAIKRFLTGKTHLDLASLYNLSMEVQVNVAADGGERVEGEYQGKRWVGYTDGVTQWKPYRIPRNANTKPEYTDVPQSWDLEAHVEGIGMTGWDWSNLVSRWVAFDFDAITGHSEKHQKKLTDSELREVRESISRIPWATIRTSTSGSGLHIYVFLETPVPTATHTEHAALGRAILSLMSAESGVEFANKVDACGQNMWVWHRKMVGTNGLTLVKAGVPLSKVPPNWRDHIKVVSNKRTRVLPEFIERTGDGELEKLFDELSGQRSSIPLDNEHKALLTWLNSEKNSRYFAYDQDNNMVTTHTKALEEAHAALNLRGIYKTSSPGSDTEQNCFMFPTRKGGWVVRRFTFGVAEAPTWDVDRSGWTRCYYNTVPDLRIAAAAFGGLEHPRGGYIFRGGESAMKAVQALGSNLVIPPEIMSRQIVLKEKDDGKLIVEVDRIPSDSSTLPAGSMFGWVDSPKKYSQVINVKVHREQETEVGNFDDVVRHIVGADHIDAGWVVNSNGIWRSEPLTHVTKFLGTFGLTPPEVNNVIGTAVGRHWTIVNRPFQPEYPGNREWNKDAVQLSYPPSPYSDNLFFPTWKLLLDHCGDTLTPAVLQNKWCQDNGIKTGGEYLKCWVAAAIQQPECQLPYLFFWSREQKTGKTMFHEALELLLNKGVVRADQALKANATHNAELEDGIFCVVEETDLSGPNQKIVYNKIKDLVTSSTVLIHRKYMTPYKVVNTTHWIHCANDPDAVPIYTGDTRIISINVLPLDPTKLIPKEELKHTLRKEAPDFLAAILHLELPDHRDRFRIPVLETLDKVETATANMTPLEQYIDTECFYYPGKTILFSDFYMMFKNHIGDDAAKYWNKNRVGRDMDKVRFPRGVLVGQQGTFIGNISFSPPPEGLTDKPLVLIENRTLGVKS